MNKKATAQLATSLLLFLAAARNSAAQVMRVSIDSHSTTISQNFDSMGSDNEALLPDGWRMGTDSMYIFAKSHTDRSAGTSGSGALNANAQGGFYNFADGDNLTSTDRSAGFLTTLLNNTPNKMLFAAFVNRSGSPITELYFAYDIEKYRTGTRANDLRLQYGTDGESWTEIPEALEHFNGDSSTAVLNPPASVNKSLSLGGLNIANESFFYLRWAYTAANFNSCQALGIDNFQLSASPLGQVDLQWDGAPGASWDAASSNWKNSGGSRVAWNDNAPNNASFVDAGAGVGNFLSLSSARRAGRITFDAGSKLYTLTGGSLQLSGAAGTGIIARSNAIVESEVQVGSSQTWDISANLTISGPLMLTSNTTLIKKGPGNLVLSGPQSHAASSQLKMTEGTLHLSTNFGQTARLSISGNSNSTDATVILDSDQELSQLNISVGDAGLQGLNLASPNSGGAFHSLRIYSSDIAAAKASLYALIRQARLTPGDGIYDSSLASHLNAGLGLAATDSYILIRPTRVGDLNLDGAVTISDFIDLASNFGQSNVTWQEGDLNFDGVVTISDFIDLASNFGGIYSGQTLLLPESNRQALESFAAAHGVAVPEPASILLVLLTSLATLRPRRLQSAK